MPKFKQQKHNKHELGDKDMRWIKSAAGKVSVILFIVSIVIVLIIACSPYSFLGQEPTEKIDNFLFGLSTNLLGIIVTVSFV